MRRWGERCRGSEIIINIIYCNSWAIGEAKAAAKDKGFCIVGFTRVQCKDHRPLAGFQVITVAWAGRTIEMYNIRAGSGFCVASPCQFNYKWFEVVRGLGLTIGKAKPLYSSCSQFGIYRTHSRSESLSATCSEQPQL